VPGQTGGWLARCLAGWLDIWKDEWLSRKSAGGNDRAEGLAVENSLKNERAAY